MNSECLAAVNALVITGMDKAEAERRVSMLNQIFPDATGIDLVLMILNRVHDEPQPPKTIERWDGVRYEQPLEAPTPTTSWTTHQFTVHEPAKLGFKAAFGWTMGEGLAAIVLMILLYVGLPAIGLILLLMIAAALNH